MDAKRLSYSQKKGYSNELLKKKRAILKTSASELPEYLAERHYNENANQSVRIRMQIRNLGFEGRTCLDSPARKKDLRKAVSLYPCHNQGGNQVEISSRYSSQTFVCMGHQILSLIVGFARLHITDTFSRLLFRYFV